MGYNSRSTRHTRRREKEHVGQKSSSQDKGEGAQEGKAKRKAKEAVGAVTGDKEKKAQGGANS